MPVSQLSRVSTNTQIGNPFYITSINSGVSAPDKVMIIYTKSPVQATTATYNGVSMERKVSVFISSFNQNHWINIFELKNPANGNFQAKIDFATTSSLAHSLNYYFFQDCDGLGNFVYNTIRSVGNSVNITTSNDSLIYGNVVSGNGASRVIQIPVGTTTPITYYHSLPTGTKTWAGVSATTLPAGTYNVFGRDGTTEVFTSAWEMKSPSTGRRRIYTV